MSKFDGIPGPAVRRLSLYLRQLEALIGQGRRTISSRELGEALSLTDAQVRKDLAYFGQFGHPGIGYRVDELTVQVRRILGTDRDWNVALVGAGNLGRALLCYRGFAKKGFNVVAVFDRDEHIVGTTVDTPDKLVVRSMNDLRETVHDLNIRLGILAVPAEAAQGVANELVEAGVQGILNFAPVTLKNMSCPLAAVDLTVHLEQLSFQLAGGNGD